MDTGRIRAGRGVPVNNDNNLGWTALQEAILLNDGGQAAGGGPAAADGRRRPRYSGPAGENRLENAERLGFGAIAKLIRGRDQPR